MTSETICGECGARCDPRNAFWDPCCSERCWEENYLRRAQRPATHRLWQSSGKSPKPLTMGRVAEAVRPLGKTDDE
jgi:hypothetical protein